MQISIFSTIAVLALVMGLQVANVQALPVDDRGYVDDLNVRQCPWLKRSACKDESQN
ncbi:hypothetical protein FA95DRAFT_1612829 [Auriscalpium vulgare]|uniref:Uncharacterized protein n=1 Tax=Auriscalpium vulgare TaxID=40419 RepID=A0ACB8R660_9AGAM|nr:hypothetical protein FA95DRAFT_1612829 [Auriscalpium vulgare]